MDVEIFGKIKDHDFHMAKLALENLCRENPGAIKSNVYSLTDTDWIEFLHKKKNELRGEVWGFKASVMAFAEGNLIGDGDDFMVWAKEKFGMVDYRPPPFYEALAQQAYGQYLANEDREVVYLDFSHDGRPLGRLIFELFKDRVPQTVENFVKFVTAKDDKKFAGSLIHRIVKNGWIQGIYLAG